MRARADRWKEPEIRGDGVVVRLHGPSAQAVLYNGAVPERRSVDWAQVALAHEGPDGLGRCLRLPLGQRGVYVCARCAGLYPALVAATAARLWDVQVPGSDGPVLRLGLPVAGALAWVVEQAGADLGRPLRVLSGILLGAGIGWAFALHLRSPWPRELIEVAAALGVALVVGLAARAVRRGLVCSGGEVAPPSNGKEEQDGGQDHVKGLDPGTR